MDQKVLHFTMKAALYSRIADSQEPHTKQANGFTDWMRGAAGNVSNWYQGLAPDKRMALMGGLIGGGGGAALGGLSAMTRPKNKRHLLRDALIGGLSGGALGVGAGYLGQGSGYLGGAGQASAPAPHSNLVNDPAMKALQGAPAAALAGMSGNPMAMMAASNAAMAPTTPSGNPVEQAYNQYLKGQSPEAAKGYFEHLGQGKDPEAVKKLTELYVNDQDPSFLAQHPAFQKAYDDWRYRAGVGGLGGAAYKTKDILGPWAEYRSHSRNPLGGPALTAYLKDNPNALDNYKVGPKHPDYEVTGEYNKALHALRGAPGAPAFPAKVQRDAIADAKSNIDAENSVIKALTPNMKTKTVKEPEPGEPAKSPSNLVDAHGRPIRPGTPEGKARLIDKEVSSWTGRFDRPHPSNEGVDVHGRSLGKDVTAEKFLDNKLVHDIAHNPNYHAPTFRGTAWRSAKAMGKGGLIGSAIGLGVPAAVNAAKNTWSFFNPPGAAATQQ